MAGHVVGRKCGSGRPGRAVLKIIMGRAGPVPAENFKSAMAGPGQAGPRVFKMWWAGPGRADTFENVMGRAGSWPII